MLARRRLALVTGPGQIVEVDVAAVVAEVLAEHATGTTVAGPESGGVQVVRVSLDVVAFRELLVAVAATLGEGSHLRLDAVGGLIVLDVTGGRLGVEQVDLLRAAAQAMDGRLVPDLLAPERFSVQVPSGLTEWD